MGYNDIKCKYNQFLSTDPEIVYIIYGSSYNFTYILLTPRIVAIKRAKSDKEIISASCDMTLSEFYLTEYFFTAIVLTLMKISLSYLFLY